MILKFSLSCHHIEAAQGKFKPRQDTATCAFVRRVTARSTPHGICCTKRLERAVPRRTDPVLFAAARARDLVADPHTRLISSLQNESFYVQDALHTLSAHL